MLGLLFCKQKCTSVFQWQEDINVVINIAICSTVSKFFEILIFRQDIWGDVHMFIKSTSFPKEL